jgi:predicted nucleic acid-binding protein
MNGRAFVVTNVLVYAHDSGAGGKHAVARELVERLWEERRGVLSTQVLQEFYVNVRRKALRPIAVAEARRIVEDYLLWQLVVNDGASILEGLALETQYRISFWDALVVQAANAAAADVLYSEDLSHGQVYGAVTVVDPFGS